MLDKLCLTQDDFNENIITKFSNLRTEGIFFDVTLVCDDQKQINAHKVALSSCSEYFKNILKNNVHSHPMLCLEGINHEDLNRLLDYIYQGEVQIVKDELDRFLKIAQRFKLQGLLDVTNEVENEPLMMMTSKIDDLEKEIFADNNPKSPGNRIEVSNETTVKEFDEIINERFKLQESLDVTNDVQKILADRHSKYPGNKIVVTNETSNEEIDKIIWDSIAKIKKGMYICKVCGKIQNKSKQLPEHIESHHIYGKSYPCDICGKKYKTRNSLRGHNNVFHK